MNIIRLIKIVAAFCLGAIGFTFIPNLIGSDFVELQIAFYVIFSIILIFIFYKLFGEDRSNLPVYDYDNEQSLDILISPEKVILFSGMMVLIPGMVVAMFFVGFLQVFKWTNPEIYPLLISLPFFWFVLYKGIRLWMRRNEVVQLRFDITGIEYMPVDVSRVGRGRGASIVSMYFIKKIVSLNYNEMDAIVIEKNFWNGDMIRITTVANQVIFLPFIPNDVDELKAVYQTLVERWSQAKRRSELSASKSWQV
ncbi:hypothetical protein [Pedobacter sp. D749]|uniref:hypothetical protein n=1 Tax=Pedobacter sp. D749 TaxID=2856523 RepID=UPI001C56B424|nr:hypothetical protein [Pedobacter sp. D749]QXU44158.1 hypothetical protein KYH19_11410 [Pedobacter sp. D749]